MAWAPRVRVHLLRWSQRYLGRVVAIASGFCVSDRIQTCARGAVTTSP